MSLPDKILLAADEYVKLHVSQSNSLFGDNYDSTSKLVRDAYIAGYKASKSKKSSDIVLDANQEKYFEQSWVAYGRKGNKAEAKEIWAKISPSIYPIILTHIKAYVNSRERQYTKDFQRYLSKKEYETIVMKNGNPIFEPQRFDIDGEYKPFADGVQQKWNPARKCLEVPTPYHSMLNDGYTNDNRPDGAMISWQMYMWKWSADKKVWIEQK